MLRGLRITVYDILAWLADGISEAEILKDYPELESTDIRACLAFAADREHNLSAMPSSDEYVSLMRRFF